MKYLPLIIVLSTLSFFACGHKHSSKTRNYAAQIHLLKKRKDSIDRLVLRDTDSLQVFVKMTGRDKLVKILNNKFPDDSVECTYNVLKIDGKILLVADLPYSESGDWMIAHKHYFDTAGKTFAFTKDESKFNDEVSGGILWQKIALYYDKDFNIISNTNKLTDGKDRPLANRKDMYDLVDDKYQVYKNVDDCLKGYNIKLAP